MGGKAKRPERPEEIRPILDAQESESDQQYPNLGYLRHLADNLWSITNEVRKLVNQSGTSREEVSGSKRSSSSYQIH